MLKNEQSELKTDTKLIWSCLKFKPPDWMMGDFMAKYAFRF